jgi:hypothetical protein
MSSDDPFDDRIVTNRAPKDLKLYDGGDEAEGAFLKFFKSVSSVDDVWKFQNKLDSEIRVLHQVKANEDNRISITAI